MPRAASATSGCSFRGRYTPTGVPSTTWAGRRASPAVTSTSLSAGPNCVSGPPSGTAPAPLPWAVSTLRTRLGAATTMDDVVTELAKLGAARSPEAELVAWLAGPYLPVPGHPGWVSTQPKQLMERTAACLAADGGVRRLVDLEAELADLGVHVDHLVPWLHASAATVVHDVVVSIDGPLVDVVERLLDAHGAARTAEQITADLTSCGRAVEPAVLASALRAHRFSCSAEGAVSLVGWPNQTRPVEARKLTTKAPGRSPEAKPLCSPRHDPGHPEEFWLWVRVDPAVLRGSEAAVPVALVEGLGLAPLTRRTFSSRSGQVDVRLRHAPADPRPRPCRCPGYRRPGRRYAHAGVSG